MGARITPQAKAATSTPEAADFSQKDPLRTDLESKARAGCSQATDISTLIEGAWQACSSNAQKKREGYFDVDAKRRSNPPTLGKGGASKRPTLPRIDHVIANICWWRLGHPYLNFVD
jgi:hypothetical protein